MNSTVQIQAWVPFLQTWATKSPGTFTLVSGVLPPAISALFGWFLPKIMRRLAKYQGAVCVALYRIDNIFLNFRAHSLPARASIVQSLHAILASWSSHNSSSSL